MEADARATDEIDRAGAREAGEQREVRGLEPGEVERQGVERLDRGAPNRSVDESLYPGVEGIAGRGEGHAGVLSTGYGVASTSQSAVVAPARRSSRMVSGGVSVSVSERAPPVMTR